MKGAGMLIVSIREYKFRILVLLKGVLGTTSPYLAAKVLFRVAREGIYKIIYF